RRGRDLSTFWVKETSREDDPFIQKDQSGSESEEERTRPPRSLVNRRNCGKKTVLAQNLVGSKFSNRRKSSIDAVTNEKGRGKVSVQGVGFNCLRHRPQDAMNVGTGGVI
ncbi:hypothetical protein Goari_021910, partial [Gossypium aridum]|nr:hypothetical protein [Gossypium aridum]